MIESFFEHPHTLRYLRGGETGPHMDAFAATLAEQGFTRDRARALLRGVAHLGHWLQMRASRLAILDEVLLQAFRAHLGKCQCVRRNTGLLYYCRSGSNRFLVWAREQGIVDVPSSAEDPPALIRDFEAWMLEHRNVKPSTVIDAYRPHLRRFLAAKGDDPERYDAVGIRSFILAEGQQGPPTRAKHAVPAIRMLLRYLAFTGRIAHELVDAVPSDARWRLAALPHYLSAEAVEEIVASCDPATVCGRRDRAVLLLLTRLGLRAGDVTGMRLGDIDWSEGTLTVSGKSRREVHLPLPQDVGDAILSWVSEGRPDRDTDHVCFGLRAPIAPLTRGTVGRIVASAAKRADPTLPRIGPRVLRHSAATAWLRDGLSLPSIGALLRHRSPDTTAIYAKVDRDLLNAVARPWPGEVSR